ncbi:hypothetical protein [Streptomyces corynorhini]|uniref:Uncharacterized protein n=1 Tax=Streptomyces corynorhini TaxID=2282652 RepID=A0A370B803_9ACTN|nr:hypothetical protein [Streptomyces corynorhini]RDG37937.1 hypothetical protein DVH02_11480 [Streptomyces corynorhini]
MSTTTLAADGGATFLGGLGTGGLALVLTVLLVLGTRSSSEHTFSKGMALFVGLAAGIVWAGAGQVWGMPNDLVLSGLASAGVGTNGPLGTVGFPAIAIVLVVIVYMMKLKPRASGVTGVLMATVFAAAGGGWAMVAGTVGSFFVGLAA